MIATDSTYRKMVHGTAVRRLLSQQLVYRMVSIIGHFLLLAGRALKDDQYADLYDQEFIVIPKATCTRAAAMACMSGIAPESSLERFTQESMQPTFNSLAKDAWLLWGGQNCSMRLWLLLEHH